MNHHWAGPLLIALTVAATAISGQTPGFLPGRRVLMDAHNCYPYEGQWTDRVDRALAAGLPVGIEIDLTWDPAPTSGAPRIVVRHGGQPKSDDPTLENYFFAKVRPWIENALKEGNRGQWPLVTLNIVRFYTLNGHGPMDILLLGRAPWSRLTPHPGPLPVEGRGWTIRHPIPQTDVPDLRCDPVIVPSPGGGLG